jgi:hypothetical protein
MNTFSNLTISSWILLWMRNILDSGCRENQNTYFMFINIFPKIVPLWDNVEKYGGARQATDDNTAHAPGMLDKPKPARAPSHAQAQKYVILLFHNSGYIERTCPTLHERCLSCSVQAVCNSFSAGKYFAGFSQRAQERPSLLSGFYRNGFCRQILVNLHTVTFNASPLSNFWCEYWLTEVSRHISANVAKKKFRKTHSVRITARHWS